MGKPRFYLDVNAAALRAREMSLSRHAAWELAHGVRLDPAAAIAQVAGIYELIPEDRRHRPIAVDGVAAMHRALAVLG